MPVDTSEKDLEAAIESVLVGEADGASAEPVTRYDVGQYEPGGYRKRNPTDYIGSATRRTTIANGA